jgi:hypothetical protein
MCIPHLAELPVTELEALPVTYVMEKAEEATVRSVLHSDEEKAALDRLLYVRDKAKAFDAAGVYHTAMIEDGTMAANAVSTARYLQRQDHEWYGNEFTHVTPCVRRQICS